MIAHVLSFAIDKNFKVVVANFDDYIVYFKEECLNNSWIIFLSGIRAYALRIIGTVFKRLRIVPKYDSFNNIERSRNKYIIIDEWNLLYTPKIQMHRNQISDIFRFKEEYLKNISILNSKKAKITIGVHIRRGDYKVWKNGKYYFSLQYYSDLIRFYTEKYQSSKVIVCSNEDINTAILNTNVTFSNANFIADLWILAHCDFIIGPPSTFNAWSSFIGNKPLYTLKSVDEMPSLDKFKIFDGNIVSLTK
jgi:hypothetical protein